MQRTARNLASQSLALACLAGLTGAGPRPYDGEPDLKATAKEILTVFNDFKENYPKHTKTLKEILEMVEPLKGRDVKGLLDEIEKLRAAQEQIVKAVRANRGGLFVPGLEDPSEAKKFSMVRAGFAVKTNRWEGAGYEKEVFDTVGAKIKHVIGVEGEGGYFVPDQIIADVIGAIYTRSVLISLQGEGTTRVSVVDGLFGGQVHIPKFKGGMLAFWIGELDEYVESATKMGDITMTPKKLTLLTRLSVEMQKFGGYGFENLLRQDMARAAAKKLDWTLLYGTGTENMPRGISRLAGVSQFSAETKAIVAQSPADSQGGELDFDGLAEMIGGVEDQDVQVDDTFAIISAPRYFRRLKGLRVPHFSGDTQGMYLLGAPLLTDNKLGEFIGDFDRTTQIPTTNKPGQSLGWSTTSVANKFGDVFAGNWGEMLLGRWGAIELISDDGMGPGFLRDQIYLKMRMFADVGVRYAQSFAVSPDVRMRT